MTVSFTLEQKDWIKRNACPYCLYGIPDYRDCDEQEFKHALAGDVFVCRANDLREALTRV